MYTIGHLELQILYLIKEHFTKQISDEAFLMTTFTKGHELVVNGGLPQYFPII